jgi:RimJ/RimL family protein N-acetyltransferase/acyl carrier protein
VKPPLASLSPRPPTGAGFERRPIRPDDVDRLIEFYGRLPAEDRYYRFFSGGFPSRSLVERWVANVTTGGGWGELLLSPGDGGSPVVIGEVGFAHLPDDAAELAITIDPRWRGWLGSLLLADVLRAAADAGHRTVEAEILATNHSMIRLARAFGGTVVHHEDVHEVRLSIPVDAVAAGGGGARADGGGARAVVGAGATDGALGTMAGAACGTAPGASEGRAVAADVVARVAPGVDLSDPSADLALDLDLDSIDMIEILEQLSRRLGVMVPAAQLGQLRSLDAIARFADERLTARRDGGT